MNTVPALTWELFEELVEEGFHVMAHKDTETGKIAVALVKGGDVFHSSEWESDRALLEAAWRSRK